MAFLGVSLTHDLVPGLGDFTFTGVTPRGAEVSFPQVVARQSNSTSSNSTSSVPTVNIFLDSAGADAEYVASIVSACSSETVYAARCTKAPTSVTGIVSSIFAKASCGPNATALTFTEGPSTYKVSRSVDTVIGGLSVKASGGENCQLVGTTAAICNIFLSASISGTTTSTTGVLTISGSTYARYQVPITAGASATVSPGACPTTGGAAAINTKAAMAWGLVGVAGVAGLMV